MDSVAAILCVDDTPANLAVLDGMLRACHFRTVCVGSAAEAFEQLGRQRFDVVLMDIFMPEMDGVEALKRLRRMARPASDLPVIAVTADQSRGRSQYLAFGFDGFAPKPVEIRALLIEIMNALAAAKELAPLRRRA